MKLGDQFGSLESACTVIKAHVLDEGESYKTIKSDKNRLVVDCKDSNCKFQIQASKCKKK